MTREGPWQLDGRTAVLGILGDPIAQVKAPAPLTALLQSQGLNAVLVPMHVEPRSLAGVLDMLLAVRNVAGLVVTVPHKQAAVRHAGSASEAATSCQAANVLRRSTGPDGSPGWQADLFDGIGFVRGLVAGGFTVGGAKACIVGAGGAASAIAFALAAAGAGHLRIHDVDAERTRSLVDRLAQHGHAASAWDGIDLAGAGLVVNATPLGMRPADPLPVPATALRPDLHVAEVVMEPAETALLAKARQLGCPAHPGHSMMRQQLDLMLEFFRPAIAAVQATGGTPSRA